MELVEGEDLAERIARGPIPLDEALPIARQIAEALEAAHEQRHHPSRSQARQHQGPRGRHRQGAGLRAGEGDRPVDGRPGPAPHRRSKSPTLTSAAMTRDGHHPRHRRLHGAGAGEGQAGGQARGHLGVRLRAVRDADRPRRFCRARRSPKCSRRDARCAALDGASRRTSAAHRTAARALPREGSHISACATSATLESNWTPMNRPHQPAWSRRRRPAAGRSPSPAAVGLLARCRCRRRCVAPETGGRSPPLRKLDLALDAATCARSAPDGSRIAYVTGDRVLVRELAASDPRDLGAMGAGNRQHRVVAGQRDGVYDGSRTGRSGRYRQPAVDRCVVCEIPESHDALGVRMDRRRAGDRGVARRPVPRDRPRRRATSSGWRSMRRRTSTFMVWARCLTAASCSPRTARTTSTPIETFDGAKRETLLPPMRAPRRSGIRRPDTCCSFGSGTNPGLWALPFGRGPLDIKQAFLVAPNAATRQRRERRAHCWCRTGSETEGESFELVAVNRDGSGARPVGTAAPASVEPSTLPGRPPRWR